MEPLDLPPPSAAQVCPRNKPKSSPNTQKRNYDH
jgi:hypothetical protein